MRRGTTPTHRFILPFDIPEDAIVRVVYAQCDKVLIEKDISQCSIDKNIITVKLTDSDTLKFNCKRFLYKGELKKWDAEIQIGVKAADGTKVWSDTLTVKVDKCLKEDGVI